MPSPPTPDAIRTAREALGLTRLELAGRIAGATPDQLAMAKRMDAIVKGIRLWETGARPPSPAYAHALSTALRNET